MRYLGLALFFLLGLAPAQAQVVLPQANGNFFLQGYFPPNGGLRNTLEPNQIFWDDFGTGTLDITNRWNATSGGGGVTPTNAVAQTVVSSGGTPNGYSLLISQPTFSGRNPGWVVHQHQVNIEFPVITGGYRAWGAMTAPGTPVASAAGCLNAVSGSACGALSNAAVFEITNDAKLRAVTYQSGNRVIVADLSVIPSQLPNVPASCLQSPYVTTIPQPQDSKVHQYNVIHRGDCIIWSIDGIDRVVTQITNGANGPDVNTLSTGAVSINISNVSTVTIGENQVTISDTSRNAQRICDATFSWRCLTVGANGGFSPINASSVTVTTPSVPTPGTFVAVLAANAARKACTITNIGTTQGYCNAILQASATTSNTMPVSANGGQFICASTSGPTASNAISCTCASGTCSFVVNEQ